MNQEKADKAHTLIEHRRRVEADLHELHEITAVDTFTHDRLAAVSYRIEKAMRRGSIFNKPEDEEILIDHIRDGIEAVAVRYHKEIEEINRKIENL